MQKWREETVCLGTEADTSLSKLLLDFLSEGKGGLALYRTFLDKTLSLNICHSNLYHMSDELLRRFYQEPSDVPEILQFSRRS